ncbi:helix-turn-helix domain-containing protein [Sphingobacterium sp. SRCM116780]|uniref:helix-turn-helix domain-containing protein n=1 Tax=Sphingobacterium sp. SRCM116780 TaxID=2907623 RepID=UPI00397EEC4C
MIKKKKHSFAFKLHCVRQMSEQYRSAKSLSEEYGITNSLFKDWLSVYQHQGVPGLLSRKGKRVFSSQFKLSVLTAIHKDYNPVLSPA